MRLARSKRRRLRPRLHRELLDAGVVLGSPVAAAASPAAAAETAAAKFEAFFSQMGTSTALDGLDDTPISSLSDAVEFIIGAPDTPTENMLKRGCDQAYAKADALLAQGADENGLTRERDRRHFYVYARERGRWWPLSLQPSQPGALQRGSWRRETVLGLREAVATRSVQGSQVRRRRNLPRHQGPLRADDGGRNACQGHRVGRQWGARGVVGLSSCSTDLQATKSFLGQSGERVLYTVEGGSSALDVRRYSEFPQENEVLMPFGSAFTVVTALDAGSGMLLITLRQDQGSSSAATENKWIRSPTNALPSGSSRIARIRVRK